MFLNEALYKAEHYANTQELENIHDRIVANIYAEAEALASDIVKLTGAGKDLERRIDDIVTSRIFGFPLILALLGLVFWLTITGQTTSALLSGAPFRAGGEADRPLHPPERHGMKRIGIAVLGTYRVILAWVLSVMLPPMAIFFPYIHPAGGSRTYLPESPLTWIRAFKRVGARQTEGSDHVHGFWL